MNQDVTCQLKRGQYLGNSKYKAVWNCGAMKSKPMKFRDWTPNVSGTDAVPMKINVYESKQGIHRHKMEPVIFDAELLGNSERNCRTAATHYGIEPGKSWGCADQLTKSWWSGEYSDDHHRGPVIRDGPRCNSRPDRNSSNYKRECKRLKFIQGTGKTSVDDEAWWKVDTQKARYQNTFGLSELILQALVLTDQVFYLYLRQVIMKEIEDINFRGVEHTVDGHHISLYMFIKKDGKYTQIFTI